MIQSRFKGVAYGLPIFFSLIFTGWLILLIFICKSMVPILPVPGVGIAICLLSFIVWMVFGEWRKKMTVVNIDTNTISVRRYWGLGKTKVYLFSELHGYMTSKMPNRYGGFTETLYFVKDGRRLFGISDYYHLNYSELKKTIQPKLKDFGSERFSLPSAIKDVFD